MLNKCFNTAIGSCINKIKIAVESFTIDGVMGILDVI